MKKDYLNYLISLETSGIKLGLERTENLMKACGSPHNSLKCAQIVGTNGKGSVSAIFANILKQSSYKVGLYTSPHLTHINERIRINGTAISDEKIVEFINLFKDDISRLKVSFFEAMTAMAIWYFKNQSVDFAILETGLGGRLDSVSICNAQIILFTRISLDHQHILGDNLEQIAYEKAGAIKSGSICMSYPQKQEVEKVLNKKVKQTNSSIEYIIDENDQVNLNGKHQSINASLAIAAAKKLKGFKVTNKTIQNGLKTVKWPGRLQKIYEKPNVYFDVAHNEESFFMLCKFVQNLNFKGKKILIIALQQNKNLGQSIDEIINIFDEIVITETRVRNFMSTNNLFNILNNQKTKMIADPNAAINYAKNLTQNDLCVIAGSHYLGPYISKEFKIYFDNI